MMTSSRACRSWSGFGCFVAAGVSPAVAGKLDYDVRRGAGCYTPTALAFDRPDLQAADELLLGYEE